MIINKHPEEPKGGNMNHSNESSTVVIVDDEEMVLESLKSFLSLETDYKVETFLSAQDALEFIKTNRVDLVISDYLMPEMDGIKFLARVREIKPQVPRIILTGYADKENAIKAINTVGLFYYIEKPWNNDDLIIILRNGVEKKRLLASLSEKIKEINKAYAELQQIQREILKAFV
jgi:DNA-binding NtrC family response regulator